VRLVWRAAAMKNWNYGRCFLVYVIIFLALFAQVCGGTRVISPLRQGALLGSQTTETSHEPENGKFSDYVTYYIPDATVFLDGKRSSWIATWMPYNELGRPISHLLGLSPAYLPNWILSKITTDAFEYVSAIAVLAMFLAGSFAFLLARELELMPAAALVAAFAIGLSPSLIYWATFPMFASAYGWAVAALYGLTRLVKRQDLQAWVTIAFAVYSLVMTAYPMMVVYHVYLAGGFFIYLALNHPAFPRDGRKLSKLLMGLGSAVAFGILAAAPALIDTFLTTLRSARTHPDIEFFRAVIPPLNSVTDWRKFLAFWTFPQAFGNPISGSFPQQFNGRSLAPFVLFLACTSDLRRTWGWWLVVLILAAAEAFPPLYAFAVAHLGLNLSRTPPTVCALVPLAMIAAVNLDGALRRETRDSSLSDPSVSRLLVPFASATAFYLILLVNAFAAALQLHFTPERWTLLALVAYLPLLVFALRFRLPGIIIVVVIAHLLMFDRSLLLTQQRDAIVQSTPATKRLQTLLADGGRFAVMNSATDFMPPNMNAQVKLSSVHTYDSLSPLRYQALIHELGGDMTTYGRSNQSIGAASLTTTDFQLANIDALITREPLTSATVTSDSNFGDLHLYRVLERWGRYTRFGLNSIVFDGDSARLIDTSSVEKDAATAVTNQGDRVSLHLAHDSATTTLLVVSQLYNPVWRADARSSDGWLPLRTLPVNDAYEGVLIPPGIDSIRLRFVPWIRWSWLGHATFGMLAMLLACSWLRGRLTKKVVIQ
jgi:hypothetical protein